MICESFVSNTTMIDENRTEVVVKIDVPRRDAAKAGYVFETFAQRWGLPIRIVHGTNEEYADLLYSPDDTAARPPAGSLRIPYDPALYQPETTCRPCE